MLKNLDPMLNADVLYALKSMGHGDTLVIADTNFPSDTIARQTVLGDLLRIDNVSAARAFRAVLSVLPLDTPFQPSVGRMEIMGAPGEIPPVQRGCFSGRACRLRSAGCFAHTQRKRPVRAPAKELSG